MESNRPTEYDRYLFHQGSHFHSYRFMGARPAVEEGQTGVRFCLWAPNARQVSVIGDFNCWQGGSHLMLKIAESGLWTIFIPGLEQGECYKYELLTPDGDVRIKADPYGYFSQQAPETASRVFSLDGYRWNDQGWLEERENPALPVYHRPVNIYEVHLGSWSQREDGSYLNYRELAEGLLEYVQEMGYNYIELLPLAEHPYDGSWGYQTTGYYSPTSRYGNPHDFMYFIDRCHQRGIGVIMDWVPGHFCKDDHGLRLFDGTALYEPEDYRRAENEWDTLNFDFNQSEVWSYLISNAVFWFEKYHIDGLRVDAVSNLIYLNSGKNDGQWVPNRYGGYENLEGIDFLKTLNKTVFEYFPGAMMIAEESTAWPLVTAPTYLGGLGFNFKWNMGWMNDILKYMEKNPVHRKWHHNLVTFSFMYAFSENFILPLSHDEVVHGKHSLIDKMPGDYWQKFANLRLLYAYMMAHPGKKLLFMGGEFAQFIEWNYRQELDWLLLDYELHRKMQSYLQELNHFYLSEETFWAVDRDEAGFKWIDPNNNDQSIIVFSRLDDNKNYTLVICNFTPEVYEQYRIGVPELRDYREVFNSDLKSYGGSGQRNPGCLRSEEVNWHNQPCSLSLRIPPLAAVYLQPC